MYTIRIEKECSCFKKSNIENNMTFETKEDALAKARVLECIMNQDFCHKHYFDAVDMGEEILFHSTERPQDEEDDEDIKVLLEKNPNMVNVSFDGSKEIN
jgi:hypothetical protein